MVRKILIYFALIISIVALLSGCEFIISGTPDHECEFTEWEILLEPTCDKDGAEESFCDICFEYETRKIPAAHSPVTAEAKEATCTESGSTAGTYCSECLTIISGIKKIPANGHTIVIDPAIPSTEDTPGRTEGEHCSVCNEILVPQYTVFSGAYSDASKYHDNYAYDSLLAHTNGKGMQDFYNEIDVIATSFHNSLTDAQTKDNDALGTIYYVDEVYFSDNGLDSREALATWSAYIKDHPLYYWISYQASHTDEYLTLAVDYEYANGEERAQINQDIYNVVEEYIIALGGAGDPYYITLGFHDMIIKDADYAYEADGVTPSAAKSAHNIVGVLLEGEGVCESYAKAFQLLLNYCGIDNVFVVGTANGPHAWNLVQLDDGRWYWYDLTWDDQPRWMLGVKHNYFCVSDADYVDWSDGSGRNNSKTFSDEHIPSNHNVLNENYTYPLPDASDIPYDYDGLMLRDEVIKQNGLSYVLIGFNAVSLTKIEAEGDVSIPGEIKHGAYTLKISCIGSYDAEERVIKPASIIEYDRFTGSHFDVTSISIPNTVEFIWDYSFDHCYSIEEFIVDKTNPAFTSLDGVLFTKSLYTLVKYPLAMAATSYTVPSSTIEIAYGAFGDGGNVFCPEYLETLTIPSNVEVIGAYNGGRGFRNARPNDSSDIIKIDGYYQKLISMLGFGLKVK